MRFIHESAERRVESSLASSSSTAMLDYPPTLEHENLLKADRQ
jgi:hypothetical protein